MIFHTSSSRRKGFTLIELLVVISIIALLASVVLGSLSTARAKGKDASRVQTVIQVRNALELYYATNKEYPAGQMTVEVLITNYLGSYIKLPASTFGSVVATSYIGTAGSYEILVKTDTGGTFNKRIGCSSSDYAAYDGGVNKTYCLGNL